MFSSRMGLFAAASSYPFGDFLVLLKVDISRRVRSDGKQRFQLSVFILVSTRIAPITVQYRTLRETK